MDCKSLETAKMIRRSLMSGEVARFVQFRFEELRISEARYKDLLSEADESYSNMLSI